MSRKKKSAQKVVEVIQTASEVVTYQVFFYDCLSKRLVQHWQEREIQTFFRGLGLKDKEPVDTYKDALAKY